MNVPWEQFLPVTFMLLTPTNALTVVPVLQHALQELLKLNNLKI
jgi:hypothetical protein